MLRVFGADLRLVPAKPYKDPGNYVRYSERLAAELAETHDAGVIWANQFDNTANMRGHYRSTARKSGARPKAGSTASPAPSGPEAPLPGLADI